VTISSAQTKNPSALSATGFVFGTLSRVTRLRGIRSTPERLVQLGEALRFADTGVGQQAGIQTCQLMTAGHAALPLQQVGEQAQRQGGFLGGLAGVQFGTQGAFRIRRVRLIS